MRRTAIHDTVLDDPEDDDVELSLDFVQGHITIVGTAPMSQSHQHDDKWLEGESPDDYDRRTWPSKLNVDTIDGQRAVVVPAMAIQRGLVSGAKFSKKQIEGHGRSTWTKRFESGVIIPTNAPVYHTCYDARGRRMLVDPAQVQSVTISANPDGVRGSGKRVPKRLPSIPPGWECEFDAMILDPMITESIFREILKYTGMFGGLGQFRPEKGGNNGRFVLRDVVWQDNRKLINKRAA